MRLRPKGEMLVLYDPRVGDLRVRIVDDGVALIVGRLQVARVKAHPAVFQRAVTIVKVRVDAPGIDYARGEGPQLRPLPEIIDAQAHLRPFQQPLDERRISLHRDALVHCVKIIVVKREAHGQAADDLRRQLPAGPPPLLFGIALDKLFVDIRTDQADRLLLQIFRRADAGRLPLRLDMRHRLPRRFHAPELIERIHVEGQVVQPPPIVGDGAVGEAVHPHEAVQVAPELVAVRMEDVRAVAMHVDAVHPLRVDVAAHMIAPVHDQAALCAVRQLPRQRCAGQPRANDQVIERHTPSFVLVYGCTQPASASAI